MRRTLPLLIACALFAGCAAHTEARTPVQPPVSSSARSTAKASSSKAAKLPKAPAGFLETAKIVTPPADKKIPILVYHHVRSTKGYSKETWSWKMSVAPSFFEKHMQWLKDKGYTTISLDTYVSIMKGEQAGPAKPVVITFDDNQPSQIEQALPVLKRNGQMAVFYLVTNRVDMKGYIPRETIREMSDMGMDIQSHTVTHSSLSLLSIARLDAELTESRKMLEEITGKPVRHIAYPSVMHNATVRAHAKTAGYVTGSIMDPRWATSKDDMYKLPRIMMTDDTDLTKVLP